MAPPLALPLLAALALALCPIEAAVSLSHAHGGGFYDSARVNQLSWRPRRRGAQRSRLVDYGGQRVRTGTERHEPGAHQLRHILGQAPGDLCAHPMNQTAANESTDILFFDPWKDETVSAIEKRVAVWTFLPKENAEPIQVLHYEIGQTYEAHFDHFHDKNNLKRGGHRIATVLMYLTSRRGSPLRYKDETWSECERSGLAVKPKKGDVLLFFSLHVNATTDTSSLLHGSCPVIEGAKWSTTKWIHVRSFDNPPNVKMDTPCSDDNELCPNWAAIGECHKNPTYMVGTKDTPGSCRKSCGLCLLLLI